MKEGEKKKFLNKSYKQKSTFIDNKNKIQIINLDNNQNNNSQENIISNNIGN